MLSVSEKLMQIVIVRKPTWALIKSYDTLNCHNTFPEGNDYHYDRMEPFILELPFI